MMNKHQNYFTDILLLESLYTFIRLCETDEQPVILSKEQLDKIEEEYIKAAKDTIEGIRKLINDYKDDPQMFHIMFCSLLSKQTNIKIRPVIVNTLEEAIEANMNVSLNALEAYIETLRKSDPNIVLKPEYRKLSAYISVIKAAKNKELFVKYLKLIAILLASMGVGFLAYHLTTYPFVFIILNSMRGFIFSYAFKLKDKILGLLARQKVTDKKEVEISANDSPKETEKLTK